MNNENVCIITFLYENWCLKDMFSHTPFLSGWVENAPQISEAIEILEKVFRALRNPSQPNKAVFSSSHKSSRSS